MLNKYQFWLSYNNNAEKLQLPVNPGELSINCGSQNTTLSVSRLGEINIIQEPVLKTFQFSSFFPSVSGPYCEYREIPQPWAAVKTIERWKNSGNPIRLIIAGTPLNYAVTVEEFHYSERGGDVGTINYDISLKEYKFISPRILEETAVNGAEVISVKQKQARPDVRLKSGTYTVKPGDTLWKIAKMETGAGANYKEIALRNDLKPPYTIYPGQVVKLT